MKASLDTLSDSSNCPCGSSQAYAACCRPSHQGTPAASPEALMRSRYTAYVLGLEAYLLETWHHSTRPAQLDLKHSPQWLSLQILQSSQQGAGGRVHFKAVHRTGSGFGFLEEESDFVQEAGQWYYTAGKTREGVLRSGRNDKCPCGSGKKFKACCLPG
jgi:SEC-C motif-containing protein